MRSIWPAHAWAQFGAWLVPVFGFFKTALFAAMVSQAPAAMAMLEDSTPPPARVRRIPGR
jgi:hypothetical protein